MISAVGNEPAADLGFPIARASVQQEPSCRSNLVLPIGFLQAQESDGVVLNLLPEDRVQNQGWKFVFVSIMTGIVEKTKDIIFAEEEVRECGRSTAVARVNEMNEPNMPFLFRESLFGLEQFQTVA